MKAPAWEERKASFGSGETWVLWVGSVPVWSGQGGQRRARGWVFVAQGKTGANSCSFRAKVKKLLAIWAFEPYIRIASGFVGPTFLLLAREAAMHESTLEVVRGLVEPLLEREGVDLVDLELKGAPGRQVLRVFVDVDGGITIDQCVLLSRKISDLLDRKDPIPGKYRLEVSSPGVDRPLTRPRDFQRNIGREVKVDVRRGEVVEQVTGKIVSVGEENLTLDVKGEEVLLEWTAVVKGKIQVRF